jgi:hypothetical protein
MFWRARSARFLRWMLPIAFALSFGPVLLWNRLPVLVAGAQIPLPMAIYTHVPILGSVGQSGRYMVIGYVAIGLGVGALVRTLRRTLSPRAGLLAAGVLLALVATDYAWKPLFTPMPTTSIPRGPGRVLDPRPGGRTLYFQTQHGRPLVGGYVSRLPLKIAIAYQNLPGVGWMFRPADARAREPLPTNAEIVAGLRALDVRYVVVAPMGDDAATLERAGLELVEKTPLDATFRVADDAPR